MITDKEITDLSDNDLISLLLRIESLRDIRTAVVTRSDVNNVFHDAIMSANMTITDESQHIEVRDLTDAEWEEFCQDWFWRKGHSDIFWSGDVHLAIHEDLQDRGFIKKAGVTA